MLRVDHAVTSGPYTTRSGERITLDNNAWVLGDDTECLVVDAPHDAEAIVRLVRGRRTVAIVCTHGHADHVRLAPEVGTRLRAPTLLHPDDLPLWRDWHPDVDPDGTLGDGDVVTVAGTELHVLHTPGHTPGSCCLHVPDLGLLLSGDTLFPGGPGATRGRLAHFPTIIASIRGRLLTLPPSTAVLPGHGPSTTIAAEAGHVDEWERRGW